MGGGVLAVERALPPFSQFSRSGARTPHAVLARATRRYARTNNRRALDMHSLPVAALLLFTYIALFDLLYADGVYRCCLVYTPKVAATLIKCVK